MLPIKNLKKLIATLPDDAFVVAYTGEACGLQVCYGRHSQLSSSNFIQPHEKGGWIETGYSSSRECDPRKHDLKDFTIS